MQILTTTRFTLQFVYFLNCPFITKALLQNYQENCVYFSEYAQITKIHKTSLAIVQTTKQPSGVRVGNTTKVG